MTDLPPSWASAQLSDLGPWIGGGTPSKANPSYWHGPIPWVSPKDMKTRVIWETGDGITTKAIECSSARCVPPKSVLIVTRSGILAHSLPVAVTAVESALNQDLKALIPPCGIVPDYIAWGLRACEQRILNTCRKGGTTVHSIETTRLSAFELPIAPTNEQHRIVERIETLFAEIDRGVESLRTAKRNIGLYRQSLLKSAFEGRLTSQWRIENPDKLECPEELLARIREQREERYQAAIDDWRRALAKWRHGGNAGRGPKKPKQHVEVRAKHIPHEAKPTCVGTWASARLGDLNVLVSDGPFGSNLMTRDYTDTGVRVVRLENIGYGKFLEEKRSFISHEKFETIKKHSVVPGTIVVSSFVTEGIRCCIVPKSISIAVNKADCLAVTVLGERTRREFLAYFLQSRQAFGQLEGVVHGVGRPRINTAQLRELHVPVCDPAEQFEIVRILDARLRSAEALDTEIDTNIARAEALRQSILKKAFSGDLVPQDPNDEPAHALLARIRASRQGDATAKPRRSSRRRAHASTPP